MLAVVDPIVYYTRCHDKAVDYAQMAIEARARLRWFGKEYPGSLAYGELLAHYELCYANLVDWNKRRRHWRPKWIAD